jgi:hypothetical protein
MFLHSKVMLLLYRQLYVHKCRSQCNAVCALPLPRRYHVFLWQKIVLFIMAVPVSIDITVCCRGRRNSSPGLGGELKN